MALACGGHGPRVAADEDMARTLLRLARETHEEHPSARVKALYEVAKAYPSSQSAPIALQQATRIAINAGHTETQTWLASKLTKLSEPPGSLSAECLWLNARLMIEGLGDYPAARQLLRRLYTQHAISPRADNALWTLADLYRAVGAWKHAHKTYRILAQHRLDRGWLIGSLRSPYTAQAALLKADIEAYIFDDFPAAVGSYRSFLTHFNDSLFMDDALLSLAYCYLRTHEKNAAEDVLAQLDKRALSTRQSEILRALRKVPDAQIPIPKRLYSTVSPHPKRLR
ncbi:MAG: hypothetical protein VYA30_16950 [Myxococcota bacterium]|nr:hypothetical protein [Myxococcota bacterium]